MYTYLHVSIGSYLPGSDHVQGLDTTQPAKSCRGAPPALATDPKAGSGPDSLS